MFQNPTYVTVLKNFHSSVSLLNSAGFAFKMFKSSILPKPYVHNVSGRFFFVFLSRWDLHRKQEKLLGDRSHQEDRRKRLKKNVHTKGET